MKLPPLLSFPSGAAVAPASDHSSLRTPETVASMCAAIRESGLSDRSAAALAGVSSAALARWRLEDAEFGAQLDAAREEFAEARLQVIREARNADGSLDRHAQAWLLKMGYRK